MTDLSDDELDALASAYTWHDSTDTDAMVVRLIAEVRRWRNFYDRAVESGYVTADGPKEERDE